MSACTPKPGTTAGPEQSAPHAEEHADHHGDHHGGHHGGHHGSSDVEPSAAHDGHGHHRHHRFDNAEEWAKQFDDPSRDEWQRPTEVIDFIAPAADALIADLGAGTGYFSIPFAQRVPDGRVFANDIEPDMVRYLGERAASEGLGNIIPVLGETGDPKLPESVDVAFMCDVYHHIEDRPGYFRHVAKALREGGRVVIVDFKKDAPDDVPGPPPAMRIAQEQVVRELSEAGLALSRADRETLPHQYIVEFVAKTQG